jgi:hypothetical protein
MMITGTGTERFVHACLVVAPWDRGFVGAFLRVALGAFGYYLAAWGVL